ncbi:MarR family winged helix-turn-helix transcriptional regulator [Knoellia koreensis]|uniref:MarR family transcriptional regulator n=1 Tax=Knoellia koreensis TaxID=2730921 RepID=A0A849HBV2_9MICO|nr:MarR family transcriptional regulator [Knoellia sp. DB2414S]NNM47216.1 MarR family transcriptional regulator [Knoellia sp. DB2414S]
MAATRHTPARTGDDQARLDALDSLLRLGMELRRHVETVAHDFGISAPQARLVVTLSEPMRMQQAAEATACEPSHLTALADQLEGAGLLTRKPDPTDRRARQLCLTTKGKALRTKLVPAVVDGAPVVGRLDGGQCGRLRSLIEMEET